MNDGNQTQNICQTSWHTFSHSALCWPLSEPPWLFGTLLVTQRASWLLGILATRRPYGGLPYGGLPLLDHLASSWQGLP